LNFISAIVPIFVPIILDINFICSKSKSSLEWVLAAWLTLTISVFFYLAGAWFLSSLFLRYIILLLAVIVIVASFHQLPGIILKNGLFSGINKFTLFSYLIPVIITSYMVVNVVLGYQIPDPTVSINFPVKDGAFFFVQAGSTSIVNYHHPYGSQAFAQDIIALNSLGRNTDGFRQISLEDYEIFGKTVISPCDGQISKVVDGLTDLSPGSSGDTTHAAGNHVFLWCEKEQVQIFLAHMKRNSLVVKEGDIIKMGDPIGQVGNSGNSTEPHLHIHARRGGTPDKLTSGAGIPILYNGRFFVRNDVLVN
jgi:hypothetical protein